MTNALHLAFRCRAPPLISSAYLQPKFKSQNEQRYTRNTYTFWWNQTFLSDFRLFLTSFPLETLLALKSIQLVQSESSRVNHEHWHTPLISQFLAQNAWKMGKCFSLPNYITFYAPMVCGKVTINLRQFIYINSLWSHSFWIPNRVKFKFSGAFESALSPFFALRRKVWYFFSTFHFSDLIGWLVTINQEFASYFAQFILWWNARSKPSLFSW